MKLSDESSLWLGHFRQGSISLRPGDVVSRGQELGRVGNSGHSNRPHLHISAFKLPNGLATKPIAFTNVTVSLNPIPNDPWARRLPEWTLREGMFIEGF
jgi:murein DD-endopeptidase MepM/ murein hydrolase activator NlpD